MTTAKGARAIPARSRARRAPSHRARLIDAAALALSLALSSSIVRAGEPLVVPVDRDDDDADGVPDREQPRVPHSADLSLLRPARSEAHGARLPGGSTARSARSGRGDARLLVDGAPAPWGDPPPASAARVELQATRPGRLEVAFDGRTLAFTALEVRAVDGEGREVDLTRSHASLQRTPPDRLGDDPFASTRDPDALRVLVIGEPADLPGTITLRSVAPSGEEIDVLRDVPLGHVPCPPDVARGLACGSTKPIRAVADEIDRAHPMVADRSIKAELGGAIVVTTRTAKLQQIRVGGPRASAVGPIVRYRGRLRVVMVRARPGGPPPMGGDAAGAVRVVQDEVRRANALWGACGIGFGPPEELDVTIVDPPRSHLVALGCDHGLPSSGGTIRLRVEGREVSATIGPGLRPAAAARLVAAAIESAGVVTRISDNPRIGAGAYGSSDVLVRKKDGSLATLEPPRKGPISTDATMTACLGAVDFEDGLQHFSDVDAIAGTVEERTLLKAFDDGDPTTIDVIMVPSFAGGGRIGESFIAADGGALRNAIIEDRAGIRADRASFALAHELGHVLLDEPGHPDDFGVDTPTRLMDADAANTSAFGPRRLLVEECERALRQNGPGSPVPLLAPWPFEPLGTTLRKPAKPAPPRAARATGAKGKK